MGNSKYGILHNHTESSIRDSAMTTKQLFERAKALNAPAVALTDHGILTGIIDFMKMGAEYGIKPIPGIEAYYVPDGADISTQTKRQHLILMAKDLQGYHAICQANYLSYSNIVKDQPCMDMRILREVFGPGSDAHGHVIATSACINGVLASVLLEDEHLKQSVERLERQRDKYHPIDEEVGDAVYQEESLVKELEQLIARREELTAESKINLLGYRRRLKTLKPEDEDYESAKAELDDATERKRKAAEELEKVKRAITAKRKEKSDYSKSIAPLKQSAERWASVNDKIEAILAAGLGAEALYNKAKEICLDFVDVFGIGNFYIELQYHHISDERAVMPQLAKIAEELNIPVVAANDAHYATNSRDDIRARTLVAAMRFNKPVEEDIEGFGELYIRDDDELLKVLSEVVPEEVASKAIENIGTIVDACDVKMEHSNHYPVFPVGPDGETAAQRLRRLAEDGIPKRYPGAWTKELNDRMEYELSVINTMGYSDYLCIVQDFLDYGRKLGFDCPEKIGYTIGPGRGSAVGSIVCYLTGITSVDPIRYGLLFERFLNPERVSMPDIDSDFAGEIRDRVIEYVRNLYQSPDPVIREHGEPICSIITRGTMQAKAALRNVARVTNIPTSIADEMARQVPAGPHTQIIDIPNLQQQCDDNPVVRQLITDALLVEGTTINYGVHAAGVIIADNGDVGQYVPLYRNIVKNKATGPWVAQLDMGQCENDAGLLKMDFLGLNNLDIITDTLRRIKRNYNLDIDIEHLDEESEVFSKIFSAGNTDSVFQFESEGMKDMLRRFQPNSMEDVVLLVAAYRPGPMQYIPDIINVKHGKQKPHYIADGLEEILKPTYGYPIYQEQVMQIFNKIGGFSLGESDIIRRAMSKKKLAVLTDPKTNYQGKFIDGLLAHGATQQEADDFWNQLLDFANYAFNKSHAAAYATVSYMTAWLKYHYPAEYMSSVMSRTTFEKLPQLVGNCRKMGLAIAQPDINASMDGFTNQDDTILYGLGNIKGIGNSGTFIIQEREERGPFISIRDFVTRMLSGPYSSGYNRGMMENLIKAGAFDAFCDGNRASLLNSIDEFTSITKKMLDKTSVYEERAAVLEDLRSKGTAKADIDKAERSLASAKKSLDTATTIYTQHNFLLCHEDMSEKLAAEFDLLGVYISGNPFDAYSDEAAKIRKRVTISDAMLRRGRDKFTVCGIVKSLELRQRKSDSATFATFSFFDETGEMEAKCFTKAYAAIGDLIQEGAALKVTCRVSTDKRTDENGDEVEMGVYLNFDDAEAMKRNANEQILAVGRTVVDWQENLDEILKYQSVNGYELIFSDAIDLCTRKTGLFVSKNILNAQLPGLTMKLSTITR